MKDKGSRRYKLGDNDMTFLNDDGQPQKTRQNGYCGLIAILLFVFAFCLIIYIVY